MFFGREKAESVALIDIESASVSGALARIPEKGPPTLYYSARLPIAFHEGEAREESLSRALSLLGQELVEQGGPVLRRETGGGHIGSVLAVMSSPWNKTSVRIATVEKPQEFSFSKSLLAEALASGRPAETGGFEREELVIAAVLNGYDVENPFGKRAKRADLIVLSSETEKQAAEAATAALRKAFHADQVRLAPFAPAAYAVFRDLFPHEKDFLLLHVSGDSTDLAFVKRGLLVDVTSVPHGMNSIADAHIVRPAAAETADGVTVHKDREGTMSASVAARGEEWLSALSGALRSFAERHPLPRNVFLLSRAEGRSLVALLMGNKSLHSLWLSDEPLSVIPLLAEHFAPYAKARGEAGGDAILALIALYAAKKPHVIGVAEDA